jgi:hypothetical protein
MLGTYINPMLDFRDNLKHITVDVRMLAKVLTKRRLLPNRAKIVIDQLLNSKYHANHLGKFTDKQLETIYKLFNKVERNALGLAPKCPAEAIHRPTTELGIGCILMKDIATQMSI